MSTLHDRREAANAPLPQPDNDAALDFLRRYEPGGPWALCAIQLDRKKIITRTFHPGQETELLAWLGEFNGQRNIYFHVNPPMQDITKKAEREDIKEVRWLHVDIDPRAGEDIGRERERALAMLTDRLPDGVPPPTVVVFSGGGYQAFWRLAAPIPIGGDLSKAEDAKRYNQQLEMLFGADNCHNIDRIMRLPGTVNLPDLKKQKKGRVAALACIAAEATDWDRTHALAAFQQAPLFGATTPSAPSEPRGGAPSGSGRGEPATRLADIHALDQWSVPDRVKVAIMQGRHPDEPKQGDNSRSVWVHDVACNLVRCGVPDHTVLAVLLDPDFGISESVLELGEKAERYAWRQIERAREKVAQDAPHVRGELECNDKGVPFPTQGNIRIALGLLGAQVSYDAFQDRCLISGVPEIGPALSDAAMARLFLLVDERFRLRPPKLFFWMVVEDAARRASFHPVRDYLAGLAWDGQPRIDRWLTTHGGAEETPYSRAVGRLLLVAAVRRVRQPGCKFDEMVVLEGQQGANKSSALRVLAVHDDWFTDDLPLNVESKVVIERLAGRWIAEAAELKGMRGGAVEHLKSFLSRSVDRARMSYDRMVSEVQRQCVIVGTTNSEHYLRDGTGNRRFWPVRIERMDLDALRRDRDQLWAEAAAAEAAGESIRLPEHLWADAAQEQEARRVEEPFAITLGSALGDISGKLLAADAWKALNIADGHRTQDHNARLGEAMRELGWERRKLKINRQNAWCYLRGDDPRRIVLHETDGGWIAHHEGAPPLRETRREDSDAPLLHRDGAPF